MSNYFLDSSALVKYFVREAGTEWVQTIIDSEISQLLICRITIVEVISALSRINRESKTTATVIQDAKSYLFTLPEQFEEPIEVNELIVSDQFCHRRSAIDDRR